MFATLLLSVWKWLEQLGGPGLIALGIADASLIPIPGSLDALTVILAASNRSWWPYYALMATVGSVVGSYLTYRLGLQGGKEGLEKKVPAKRLEKITSKFEEEGFGAVFVPTLLPPPVPLAAFVLVAGALQYPLKKFLVAFSLGRALRYSVIAFLASIYGKSILGFLYRYYQPVLYALLSLLVAGIVAGVYLWLKSGRERAAEPRRKSQPKTKGTANAVPPVQKDSAA